MRHKKSNIKILKSNYAGKLKGLHNLINLRDLPMRGGFGQVKNELIGMTELFAVEKNLFRKCVIIYNYIEYIKNEPIIKPVLEGFFVKVKQKIKRIKTKDKLCPYRFGTCYGENVWQYYANLEFIHFKMKKLKLCHIDEKEMFKDLNNVISQPYSQEMLELSFRVMNSAIFDCLDRESFISGIEDKKTWFDVDKSILYVVGKKIKISKQDKITNAHKVLKYIFVNNKDNLDDDFFYSEIAETEFGELDYKGNKSNWKRYHNICTEINKKIKEETGIKKFLLCNTGRTGKIRFNKKYL